MHLRIDTFIHAPGIPRVIFACLIGLVILLLAMLIVYQFKLWEQAKERKLQMMRNSCGAKKFYDVFKL